MTKTSRRGIRLLMLMGCLLLMTSLMAQDATPETPTEAATEIVTEVPTDAPTLIPTEAPTEIVTEIVTDVPTDAPTLIPTETATEVTPDVTEVPSQVATVTPVTPVSLTPEPVLTLILRELFETGLPAGWVFPAGWSLTAVTDGSAVLVNGAAAGARSRTVLSGAYGDVAAMGYFTLSEGATAQVIVRQSAAGAYTASLNASGLVTLEKVDAQGAAIVLGTATVPVQTAPRGVRVSAIGDVLRVSVDNGNVLAVQDAQPLPAGSVSMGAAFDVDASSVISGTLLLDNVFVWQPASDSVVVQPTLPTETATPATPTEVVVTPESTPVSAPVSGKSTVFRPAPLVAGALSSTNDAFASRAVVAAVPYAQLGDINGNSVEAGEPTPLCGFNITNTAWYEFTPPAGGAATESFIITTLNSTFDTILSIYTDSNGGAANLADLTPLVGGCSDDNGSAMQAQLTLTLNDSTTYYIQMGGYNGSVGNFALAVLRPTDQAVPTAPVLSATNASAPTPPLANAVRTNQLQPVLAWNASGAVVPFSYEVQVSTVNTFTSLAASAIVTEPTRFYQVTPDLPTPAVAAGQVYYWRVRARNVLAQPSAWSAVYSFTLDRVPPATPALTAPAVNAVVSTLRPTFTWAAVADAAMYHLRIASNFSCQTPVSGFDLDLAAVTKTFTTDLPQGEYWFCVTARDVAGNISPVSEVRRFVVNISLTPANNALVTPLGAATTANLAFTWAQVPGASSYTIEISPDSSFTTVFSQTVTTTSFTRAAQPFGVYYWRVTPNTSSALNQSLARRVTITPAVPGAPAIQTAAPLTGAIANAGFTNDTTPLFDWTVPANWVTPPSGQSLTYELQLSTNNTFTALIDTMTGLTASNAEWTPTTLAATPGTVYYWRVRAVTNLGVPGAYSAAYSFTLDTVAPAAPASLTAPANNAVVTTARPAFSWAAVAGATSYVLDLSEESDFSSSGYGSPYNPPTPSYALTVSQKQSDAPIYWHVRARDAAGNLSAPSVDRTLYIDYVLTPADEYVKTITAPAVTASVAFTWAPVTGLTGAAYKVTIYKDEGLATEQTNSGSIAAATWTSPALPQGEYWWTLTVSNGALGVSRARHFIVSAPLPGAPAAPLAPAAATVTKDTTPSFNWGTPTLNAASVVDYELQISTVNTFTTQAAGSPYIVPVAATRPFEITTPLPDTASQVYFWRVRARTALGAGGPFTTPLAFTLDTTAPAAPASLTAPLDNAVVTAARPVFTWAAVAGAKGYKIEVATDNAFTNLAFPAATPTAATYTPTQSLPQGTYFWHVLAVDPAGNESLFTPGRTFKVDYRTAPAANTIFQTATTANVSFTWALVPGAPVGTTYKIEIDNDFDNNADTSLPTVTTANVTAAGLAQGDYQYRLVVSNGFGTSEWRPFFIVSPLPGAPVAPFAPVNAARINDTTPTLQWGAPTTNAANITGYLVEVSTANTFASQISGSPFDVTSGRSITLPTLPDTAGQVYYWRVRAKGGFGQVGTFSAVQSFTLDTTPPAAGPSLTAPADTAILTAARPPFSWAAAAEATGYVFQLTQDSSDFDPLVFPEVTVTAPAFTIPVTTPYLRQGTYFWRVIARDAAGNLSTPSVVRSFVVNYSLTPANNQVIVAAVPPQVTFTWAAVPGTADNKIIIEVDNNSDFSSPERTSPELASSAVTYTTSLAGSQPNTTPLAYGKYYWRVRPKNDPVLPNALAFSFTINPTVPPAPVLSTVTPAAITNDPTPNFAWTAVASPAGATIIGYELQLSTVTTFATLVGGTTVSIPSLSTPATSYEWTPALPDAASQLYYARLRAVTDLGGKSAWSAVRSFTFDSVAPTTAPTLVSPADNAVVTTQTPTFQWATLTGAARYEIRYDLQSDLSAVTPISVTGLTHVPAGNLALANYYWQVRAVDAAGNAGPWSVQRLVKITSSAGIAPFVWNTLDNTPTLTWTYIQWADTYDIQVSRSATFTTIVWEDAAVASSATPSATVSAALPNGVYFWRVRARTSAFSGGQYGAFSDVSSFNVEAP